MPLPIMFTVLNRDSANLAKPAMSSTVVPPGTPVAPRATSAESSLAAVAPFGSADWSLIAATALTEHAGRGQRASQEGRQGGGRDR
jgi:hypothetical protein